MVIKKWEVPVDSTTKEPKAKTSWMIEEKKRVVANSWPLNAIFGGVSKEQFKLISTCETGKEACDALCSAFEGSTTVRKANLHQVIIKFDALRMSEEESIAEYHARIHDLTNQVHLLGQLVAEIDIVRKLV